MGIVKIVMAIFLILIGIIKSIISILALTLTEKYKLAIKKTHKFFGTILNTDNSFAGRNIDVIILLVGLYACMHGFVMLNLMPEVIENVFAMSTVHVCIYLKLGLYCLIFYSLVLYTNVPINKDNTRAGEYKIFGLGCALLFFASAPLAVMLHNIVDNDSGIFTVLNMVLLFIALIFITIYVFVVIIATSKQETDKHYDVLVMTLANVGAFFVPVIG